MINDVIGVLGLIGGVVAFVVGLREYREAQRWKRAEWLAKLIDDFEKNPKIHQTLMILDWCERKLDNDIYWNEGFIRDALLVHTSLPDGHRFSGASPYFRECFDEFLNFMVRLQGYIEDGLIDEGPAMRYFGYWILRVHEMDQYENLKAAMDAYVCAYSDAEAIHRLYISARDHSIARLLAGRPTTKVLP